MANFTWFNLKNQIVNEIVEKAKPFISTENYNKIEDVSWYNLPKKLDVIQAVLKQELEGCVLVDLDTTEWRNVPKKARVLSELADEIEVCLSIPQGSIPPEVQEGLAGMYVRISDLEAYASAIGVTDLTDADEWNTLYATQYTSVALDGNTLIFLQDEDSLSISLQSSEYIKAFDVYSFAQATSFLSFGLALDPDVEPDEALATPNSPNTEKPVVVQVTVFAAASTTQPARGSQLPPL